MPRARRSTGIRRRRRRRGERRRSQLNSIGPRARIPGRNCRLIISPASGVPSSRCTLSSSFDRARLRRYHVISTVNNRQKFTASCPHNNNNNNNNSRTVVLYYRDIDLAVVHHDEPRTVTFSKRASSSSSSS